MISAPELAKMKKGVTIINTSRGAVIDESALVDALDSGHVWSCGLDVFEEEPKVHPGLLRNQQVMLLPHLGTWTEESQKAIELEAIKNVRSALETGRLVTQVPEQAGL